MKYIDFGFKKETLIAFSALLISVLFVVIFNIEEIGENTFLENIQLLALFAGMIFCFKAKNHKILFRIIAFILILMFMREISYGRTVFARIPGGEPGEIYQWSHFKYGWMCDVVVGIYIALCTLYAILNKIWIDIIDIVKKIKFPVWDILICFICVFCQIIGENCHSTILEETAEFVFYCSTIALILIYQKTN